MAYFCIYYTEISMFGFLKIMEIRKQLLLFLCFFYLKDMRVIESGNNQFINFNVFIGTVNFQFLEMKHKGQRKLTHEDRLKKCEEFLKTFEDYDFMETNPIYDCYGRKKYLVEIQKVTNGEKKVIDILFQDLESFYRKEDEKSLVNDFRINTVRYTKMFTEIIFKIMPTRSLPISGEEELRTKFEGLLNNQRKYNMSQRDTTNNPENQKIPDAMLNSLEVYIIFGPSSKIQLSTISDLSAQKIGSLVVSKAIVIKASDIRPQLEVATYACDVCGFENYQEINDREYKPLVRCLSKKCVENKVNGKLTFLPGHSTFKQYQELKVQETPDQLKTGKIPKSFTVHLKGQNCKQAAPGDVIMIQGVLLPKKKVGYHNSQSLTFNTYIEAFKITREKKKYIEMNLTEEEISKIQSIRASLTEDELFKKMSKSIAPEIYGLENVKKALLLLMVGGVTKITEDNLRIRGEINIALIGDPGIAKSQLLKHIAQVAPRGVYTSGKGSSGVGLTAAVTMDPETREVSLEAGALVLADMGVCCIDEFDKMGEYDRTAIHEVMQQQTVSIAKAGITTSLNARVSMLAAANPLYGRYNKKQSVQKNINLPAALLSRFDLIFILLDNAEINQDKELAMHIGKVHQNTKAPEIESLFDSSFIRHYVAISKRYHPIINEQLHKQMIERYVEKRQLQMDASKEGQNYTTMRSLLALIRLCQARAKLRFSNQVTRSDVIDCLEIIDDSQRSGQEKADLKEGADVNGSIFAMIKMICGINRKTMAAELSMIEKRVLTKGYSQEDLERTLREYEKLNVIMVGNGWVTLIV